MATQANATRWLIGRPGCRTPVSSSGSRRSRRRWSIWSASSKVFRMPSIAVVSGQHIGELRRRMEREQMARDLDQDARMRGL